jgi:hypothetical protein
LMEFQLEGWYLKATDILEFETSLALTAHSESAAVFTAKDCKAKSIMIYWRQQKEFEQRHWRSSVGRSRLLFRMMRNWQQSLPNLSYAFLTCLEIGELVVGPTAGQCHVKQQRCY